MSLTSFTIPSQSENLTEINRPWRVFLDIVYNAAVFSSITLISALDTGGDDVQSAFIYVLVTLILLAGCAFLAFRGRVKLAANLQMPILFLYFIFATIWTGDFGNLHALLAIGMFGTTLLHVGSFREERYSYIALFVGAGVLFGLSFYGNAGLLTSLTNVYRPLLTIFVFIQFGILAYVLIEQFNQFRLITKFIVSVVVLAFISITVTITAVSYLISRSATEDIISDLQVIADNSSLQIGEFIARNIFVLETFNGNQRLQEILFESNQSYNSVDESDIDSLLRRQEVIWRSADLDARATLKNQEAQAFLNEFSRFVPHELDLIVTDQYGKLLATTGNPNQYYYGDENWFFNSYASGLGERFISEPYVLERDTVDPLNEIDAFDEDDVVIGIDVAIPLLAFPENRSEPVTVGVLKSTLIVNDLFKELTPEGSRADELELLTNNLFFDLGNRTEIGAPEEPNFDLSIVDQIRQDGYTLAEFEGEISYLTISPVTSRTNLDVIDNLGWITIIHQNEREAASLITEQQRVQTIIGMFIMVVGGLAAVFVGRIVVTPLTNLAEFAQRIAQGERNIRAEVQTGDELSALADSFNQMVIQIEENERNLEQRVFERTRILETSSRIGRSLSSIVELDALVSAVVEQIKQSFDYYHVHVYMPSKDGEYLEMVGGSGEIGQQLLTIGHKMPIGSGLVGRAATTKTSILEPDVSQAENWRPNELLPETQSELAVPILLNEKLLGVLDIQNNIVNSLQREDVGAVEAIAYQIAVAIQNTQRYEEAQREAEREQLINQINQKILATSDMETAMKVALRELGQVLDGAKAVISLGPSRGNGHD